MTEAVAGNLPVSLPSRLGFWLALIGVAMMVLAALGNRVGIFNYSIGIPLFGIGLLVAITAISLGVFGIIRGQLSPAVVGGAKGWLAILIGGIAFAASVILIGPGLGAPVVHDVTTSPGDPPEFIALNKIHYAGRDYTSFAGYQASRPKIDIAGAYPDLRPLQFEQPMDSVFKEASAVAGQMGWQVAAEVPEDGRIEATATTPLFGYKDDIVIRVRPGAQGGTVLDIRSASRVGESDLGTNAKRIRAFTAALAGALKQKSGGQ